MADIARRKAAGARIEIWFQDEARIGQKNKITRRWARRGTRPRAPHDQRTRSAYIFGAICPKEGKAAGLVLPFCNSAAMTLHFKEISGAVAPDAHAVVVMDQAGWHTSGKLDVPANVSILALPSRAPELNPVEKRLAVHARQLAVQPRLQLLRRHRRPLLRGLEQTRRSAMENHVDRTPQMDR